MTFNDLVFKPHRIAGGKHATLDFPNGYGVSVVNGPMFYTDGEHEYELAVLKDGNITYSSGLTEDVMGHLSEDDVTEVIQKVEALP